MDILLVVLSGFILAPFMPWLHRPERSFAGWLAALLPLSIAAYLLTYTETIAREEVVQVTYQWVPALQINLAFYLDGLSFFFVLLVTLVGALVFIYAGAYIKKEVQAGRFYSYMLGFMASMLGLVLANNLFTLYIFFELTTVTSFFLIAFKHKQKEAREAARQALLVTNMGGLALLAAFLLMGQAANTYEISALLSQGNAVRTSPLYLPILLLFLSAAFTKSAQFPFYFWLPSAMVAPTPVSAYLHSAAMVKAGIYLLARFTPVLAGPFAWHLLVTSFGACTMLLGGWLALRYTDLKRVLAYSTIMALGLLVMLLGISGEEAIKACVVFIVVHAAYKAALFMVAGALDHETGTRDVTRLGGLKTVMPLLFAAALGAGLSMAGILPFFGFVGKELIYKTTLASSPKILLTAAAVLGNIALVAAAAVVALQPFLGRSVQPTEELHRPALELWLSPLLLAGLGLLLGLIPSLIGSSLIAPAASAVLAAPVTVHLKLWHGLTPELGLSILTVAAGVGVYTAWGWLHSSRPMQQFEQLLGSGLNQAYQWGEHTFLQFAHLQTRLLQNGFLRSYLLVIFITTVLLVGYPFFRQVPLPSLNEWGSIRFYEAVTAVLILLVAASALRLQSRLSIIVTLSVASFGISLTYLFFSAPDVALARLLIEIFTAILVVIAFIDLPDLDQKSPSYIDLEDALVALSVGGLVTMLTLAMLELPFNNKISTYYALQSYPEAHGRNIVNTILVDFRALDTLGEIMVLTTAGLGCYGLIRMHRLDREPPAVSKEIEPDEEEIL